MIALKNLFNIYDQDDFKQVLKWQINK